MVGQDFRLTGGPDGYGVYTGVKVNMKGIGQYEGSWDKKQYKIIFEAFTGYLPSAGENGPAHGLVRMAFQRVIGNQEYWMSPGIPGKMDLVEP
jgi:hypothetical protein